MSNLNSSSSNSKCLVCFSLFKSERCKNPEYFTTVFDVLCRLLEIDSIPPIQWNFDQHGIPFCEVCCPAVEKLKKLNDKFKLHKREINSILHIIKQNILKSGNFSKSSLKDVNLTFINRVHHFNSQVTGGSSHVDSNNDAEDEDVNPSDIGHFLKVEIESNDDSISLDSNDASRVQTSGKQSGSRINAGSHGSTVGKKKFQPSSMKHKCEYCGKMIAKRGHLARHIRIHTGEKPYKCVDCGKAFSHKCSLVNHARIHAGVKPFKCEFCNKSFRISSGLAKHMKLHLGDNPFQCDFCEERFSTSKSLRFHRRIHTDDNPYECDFCQKCFATPEDLKLHQKVHTGDNPYQCDYCDERCATSTDLKLHLKMHSATEGYDNETECKICQKTFTTPRGLRRHKLIHTGEKPYECEICNKAFGRLSNFERHKKIHTKVKTK